MTKTNFEKIKIIIDILQTPCFYCYFNMSTCKKQCLKGVFKYLKEKTRESEEDGWVNY